MSNNCRDCMGPVQSTDKVLWLEDIFCQDSKMMKETHGTNIHIRRMIVEEVSGGAIMSPIIIKSERKLT